MTALFVTTCIIYVACETAPGRGAAFMMVVFEVGWLGYYLLRILFSAT